MDTTQANLTAALAAVTAVEPARSFQEETIHKICCHWREYVMEGGLLGTFMLSACAFGVLYENPSSPVRQLIDSGALRRVLMGMSMGLTAMGIIYSPWGQQSGAHINPAITLTFLRLRKITWADALFYIAAQLFGAMAGVATAMFLLGAALRDPRVRYVVTVPGKWGVAEAVAGEFVIAFVLMTAVLHISNHSRLSRYTGLAAGLLVASYIALEAPFSGMSMNPARTLGSAYWAGVFDGIWIYFIVPPLAMLLAAEVRLRLAGSSSIGCCKLHHDNLKRCIFCGANGGHTS